MQELLDRIMQVGKPAILFINPGQEKPFLFFLDYSFVGRAKTVEGAMIEAIKAMDGMK